VIHAVAEAALRLADAGPDEPSAAPGAKVPGGAKRVRHVFETRFRVEAPADAVRAGLKTGPALAALDARRGVRVRLEPDEDGCEVRLELESRVARPWLRVWTWWQRRRARALARRLRRAIPGRPS